MQPEEYLLASHAIHIELGRLRERLLELARFRCAETTNQVFVSLMERQAFLLRELDEMHGDAADTLRDSGRIPF